MNQEYPKIMDAVILTKSNMRKNGNKGACVTGCDLKSGDLVRFVSDTDGSPIPYHISDGFDLLDRVRVKILHPSPIGPQQENLLVDTNSFQRVGQCDRQILFRLFQHYSNPDIYYDSVFMADKYKYLNSVDEYHHSIEILRVQNLEIRKEKNPKGENAGKAYFRCLFGASGSRKYLSVTDTNFDIRKSNDSYWNIGDAYIIASIPTEPFQDGKYYKFIAAIYPLNQYPFT